MSPPDGVPDLRHTPAHDLAKIIGVTIGCITAAVTVGGIFITIGKNAAAVDRIGRIEDKQIQQQDDITSIRYEAKGANSTAQRVESKVDTGFQDINTQLRQLNITGHRRPSDR